MQRFTGKCALVTGGAGAIGSAIAERLAREGASVVLADVNADTGEEIAASLRKTGAQAAFVRMDVTRTDECTGAVERAVALAGGLDLLVNGAGIGGGAPVASLEETVWDRVLEVNLKGVYLCARAAFPALQARGGGSILNLASLAGMVALPGMGAYGTSKAGVIQLTRVLALEGAPHRIRVNALCPV